MLTLFLSFDRWVLIMEDIHLLCAAFFNIEPHKLNIHPLTFHMAETVTNFTGYVRSITSTQWASSSGNHECHNKCVLTHLLFVLISVLSMDRTLFQIRCFSWHKEPNPTTNNWILEMTCGFGPDITEVLKMCSNRVCGCVCVSSQTSSWTCLSNVIAGLSPCLNIPMQTFRWFIFFPHIFAMNAI